MSAMAAETGYWLCVGVVILVVTGVLFPAARERDAAVCWRAAVSVVLFSSLGGLVLHGFAHAALLVAAANTFIALALAGLATWYLWRSSRASRDE